MRLAIAAVVALAFAGATAEAQPVPTGYVSAFVDYLPHRSDAIELRARVFLEERLDPHPTLRITLSGFAEGLVGRRLVLPDVPKSAPPERQAVTTAVARVQDAKLEWTRTRFDVTAGFARVVWGKLDELQPSDVINPLDVSRFLFEGRNEARLPVALLRTRVFATEHTTIEGIYVPIFRRGRFDQLDEPTSPFNIAPSAPPDSEPTGSGQGGARFSTTTGRVDWSVSAYRGLEPYALYQNAAASPLPPTAIEAMHPRFTMFSADAETVRGAWGARAEVAWFTEDSFQSADVRIVPGRSFDAGAGVDRRAGAFTVSGTVLLHIERYDAPLVLDTGTPSDGLSTVSLIGSADRTFARERFRLRSFGVYNVSESSLFLRTIWMASLRDNVSLEASAGWFVGRGRDVLGRFADDDFGYVRLRYDF